MQFFTSDSHFSHLNLTQAGNPNFTTKRPYKNVDDMNYNLITNWNAVVGSNDEVYHLGDIMMGQSHTWDSILNRLNGRIFLIKGNHDEKVLREPWVNRFEWVKDVFTLNTQNPLTNTKQSIFMSHYAHRVWNKSHHGTWHLYGHSHGSLPDDPHSLSFDVGVDCHNYRPLSLREVAQIMSKKNWRAVDHHGPQTTQ